MGKQYVGADQGEAGSETGTFANRQRVIHLSGLIGAALEYEGEQAAMATTWALQTLKPLAITRVKDMGHRWM